jgi:hypothetical protein
MTYLGYCIHSVSEIYMSLQGTSSLLRDRLKVRTFVWSKSWKFKKSKLGSDP